MPNINSDRNCLDVTLHAFLGFACGSFLSLWIPSLELDYEAAACTGGVGGCLFGIFQRYVQSRLRIEETPLTWSLRVAWTSAAVCLSEGLISIAKDFSRGGRPHPDAMMQPEKSHMIA